jgi:hypothetical protein
MDYLGVKQVLTLLKDMFHLFPEHLLMIVVYKELSPPF